MRLLSCASVFMSVGFLLLAPDTASARPTPLGPEFTYQGSLKMTGVPLNAVADFQFSLWDAAGAGSPPTGGIQVGTTQAVNSVAVTGGLFTVQLNTNSEFGANAFDGDNRWLQIAACSPAGSGVFTTLSPRQKLTAAPYARFAAAPWVNSGTTISYTTGSVGIGTAIPFTPLTVHGAIGFTSLTQPMMYMYPSGTANAQRPIISHSPGFPEYGFFYQDSGDRFVMQSSAADTTPSLVVDVDTNWVAIANPIAAAGYELSVNGQVICEDLVILDSGSWPDYVLAPDYPLKPLEEVETHIREHQRLPGIPSAAELERTGISMSDMQKRMMEKIEELTLHMIDQNKRIAEQEQRIRQLEGLLRSRAAAD